MDEGLLELAPEGESVATLSGSQPGAHVHQGVARHYLDLQRRVISQLPEPFPANLVPGMGS